MSQEEGQDPEYLIVMMEKALVNLGGYQCSLAPISCLLYYDLQPWAPSNYQHPQNPLGVPKSKDAQFSSISQ